jgi:hypothetical protein
MAEQKKTQSSTMRQERLRLALRENLKRRKSQARGRAAPSEPQEGSAPHHPKAGKESPER